MASCVRGIWSLPIIVAGGDGPTASCVEIEARRLCKFSGINGGTTGGCGANGIFAMGIEVGYGIGIFAADTGGNAKGMLLFEIGYGIEGIIGCIGPDG